MSFDHRIAAAELIRTACIDRDPGCGFKNPIYKFVTEGRQDEAARQIQAWSMRDPKRRGARPFYSSCGDLAQWLLMRLGVRFTWINRNELDGWSYIGANNNVTTLCARPWGTNSIARRVTGDDRFFAGDILILNADHSPTTHVTCVIEHVPEMGYLLTGDYGQPHGALRDAHEVYESEGKLFRGQRSIDSVLVLSDVIEAARAASKLEAIETATDWRERVGLR